MAGERDEATEPPARVFDQVYAETYVPLVRLAHLLTGSNEAGEDIVQEVFGRLLDRVEDLENPAGYVRTSVVNACRSWGRRRATERRIMPRLVEVPGGNATSGELFDALKALPYRERAALVLRFYEDQTSEEIAQALGCRVGTATSLVSRGLSRLRREIEQ